MKPVFSMILLSALLASAQEIKTPLSPLQKEWGLAAAGVLEELNHDPYDSIHIAGGTNRTAVRNLIVGTWGAHSRTELLSVLDSLLDLDKPQDQIGWDYPRAIFLCRWGVDAGYLEEREAWDKIMPAARRLQSIYTTWQKLGEAYLSGRAGWTTDKNERIRGEYAYRVLVMNASSPWRTLPWNLDLGGGQRVAESTDRTAEIYVQPHSWGLMCVRLRVPNHPADPEIVAGIDQMLGCATHPTSETMEGSDWVLNAECFMSGMHQSSQIVTHFRLEPLAASLREAGFTQLFSYVQHTAGGESHIQPPSRATWLNEGFYEHVDMRWLRRTLPKVTLTYGPPPRWVNPFLVACVIVTGLSFVLALYAVSLLRRNQLAEGMRATRWVAIALWGGWLVVSIPFHGLDIAAFAAGGEGMGAQLAALRWYAPAAIAIGWVLEVILSREVARLVSPTIPFARLVRISLFRTIAAATVPLVIMLLVSRAFGWNLPFLLVFLSLATAVALISWQMSIASTQRRRLRSGELHDATFAMSGRIGAPLKRIYIEPENPWRSPNPIAGNGGELVIPERMLRTLSRSELDAMVSYGLVLMRNGFAGRTMLAYSFLAGLFILAAFLLQWLVSQNVALFALTIYSIVLANQVAKSVLRLRAFAVREIIADPHIAQAWFSALDRGGRGCGLPLEGKRLQVIAKLLGLGPDRIVEYIHPERPAEPGYPVPEFLAA